MVKKVVLVLGVVFILIGLLGFFNDPILGLFDVNLLHNLVHLLSGIIAVAAASRSAAAAQTFSKVFGVVYALVAILGFVTPGFMSTLLHVNGADNWLHVVLAVVFLYLGFATHAEEGSAPAAM